jgi:enoyl-CoA hydratase/carnithine racemase
VDENRIPLDKLPKRYPTALKLLTMNDAELAQAESRGLVRADVPRSELEHFLKEVRASAVPANRLVRSQYRKLKKQRDAILARIAEMEAKYGDLDGNEDDEANDMVIEGTAVEIIEPA